MRYIDPYELIGIANEKGLGMTDEEAVAWVKKLDFNGDGRVSFGGMLPPTCRSIQQQISLMLTQMNRIPRRIWEEEREQQLGTH
ncbi:hypothetical protein APSETT445_000028 [Aspergillus pseudonomiae]